MPTPRKPKPQNGTVSTPSLSAFKVKPTPVPAPSKPVGAGSDDRKLITLRLTYAQRRYLQKIAFDEERTVQDLVVAALNSYLAARGLGNLESVKDILQDGNGQ